MFHTNDIKKIYNFSEHKEIMNWNNIFFKNSIKVKKIDVYKFMDRI